MAADGSHDDAPDADAEPPADDDPEPTSINAAMDENAGRPVDDAVVACPYCGSTETHVENARGPSLCRTIYQCDSCESPFERFG